MKLNVYCIRDVLVGFMSPTVDTNDDTAMRNFSLMVNNNPGVIGFRPADFDLYCVGVFDSDSGLVNPINPIRFLVNGAACVGEKNE